MNPILAAVFGPLQGSTFPLSDESLTIGREPSNSIPVSDPLLSRKHCSIHKTSDRFVIRDLDSRNGISVNGLPTKEKELQHGDQIQMGDSLFLFLIQEQPPSPIRTPSDEENLTARSTTQLKMEDAIYLKQDKSYSALPKTVHVTQDLNILLKISEAVNSIGELKPLQKKLLELVFEVLPAERGTIILSDGRSYALHKKGDSERLFTISRKISGQVLQDNVAILANDIEHSEKFNGSDSLVAGKIHSLLCLPLSIFKKNLGILYLDTTDRKIMFDENHLQLAAAIARISTVAISNVLQLEWLLEENRRLQLESNIEHGMIGESSQMHKLYQFIRKVAPADTTVLIYGESGTGKELAARAIHLNSARKMKPYVAINCAAVVETLLESELFGFEKGAFTGATAQKRGKLEIANGGTVFLDEVSEMSQSLQAKLLRVLQERELDRVGGTHSIPLDIRLIAATNKNLQEAVKAGKFREDLYYRLNVVNVHIPPLRERRDDIPLLATYFANKFSKKVQRRIKGISPKARQALMEYNWPGNVREFENTIEHAVVLGSSEMILLEDLPENLLENESAADPNTNQYHEGVKQAKKQIIQNALKEAKGNMNEAAALLGINLTYLYRLMRNLNLKS